MKVLFSLFSLFYIASIFILAGSPVVPTLSAYNPYSLLHIPLYGILTFLLALSIIPIIPITPKSKNSSIQRKNNSTGPGSKEGRGLGLRLFIAGGIAFAVGIFDEVHQLYVPGRDASVSDVVLDLVGVALALVLFFGFFKMRVPNLKK